MSISYRFFWGEFAPKFGLAIKYSVYHEDATVVLNLLWGCFYFKAPMLINQRPNTEDWDAQFGLAYHSKYLWWYWRNNNYTLRMPWDWEHVRHSILNIDGSVNCDSKTLKHTWEPPQKTKAIYEYTYILESGEKQERTAVVYGEERERRLHWLRWLPITKKVIRCINISFNEEVGEGSGSWKGGVLGCGYEWLKGETQYECLCRMEKERRFE